MRSVALSFTKGKEWESLTICQKSVELTDRLIIKQLERNFFFTKSLNE